jgi:hypothetical protein
MSLGSFCSHQSSSLVQITFRLPSPLRTHRLFTPFPSCLPVFNVRPCLFGVPLFFLKIFGSVASQYCSCSIKRSPPHRRVTFDPGGSKVLKHAAYLGCAPSGSARSQPASFCSVHALDPKVYSERPLFSRNSRFPPPSQQLWARLPSSMLPARPLLCMHSDRCEAGVRPVGKFTERPRHVIQVSSSAFIRRFLPCYFPP